jgi:hypothetical protein
MKNIILLSTLLLVSACSFSKYKTKEVAKSLNAEVPASCVNTAVAEVKDAKTHKGLKPEPYFDCKKKMRTEMLVYSYLDYKMQIRTCYDSEGKMQQYSHEYSRMESTDPRMLKKVRALMDQVDQAVAKTCGIERLPQVLK